MFSFSWNDSSEDDERVRVFRKDQEDLGFDSKEDFDYSDSDHNDEEDEKDDEEEDLGDEFLDVDDYEVDNFLFRNRNDDSEFEDKFLEEESKRNRKIVRPTKSISRSKCHDKYEHLDFRKDPVLVHQTPYGECPIICKGCSGNNCYSTQSSNSLSSQCKYSYCQTMENYHPGKCDLPGNTQLNTEVPVPYYSWHDFGIQDPGFPVEKTHKKSIVASFISNCGPKKRLTILEQMEKALNKRGYSVDNYGSCLHNKNEPSSIRHEQNGNKQNIKAAISSQYYFVYSPENTYTNDYITEKFFLPFCIGTVPIYFGAPNAREFSPAPKSYIDVVDYENVEALVDHLVYLVEHEEKYNEYLEWKYLGPHRHFLAMMDFNNVHVSCRRCMRVADYIRVEYDNQIGHEALDLEKIQHEETSRYFKIRERNTFFLKYMYLPPTFTIDEFKQKIIETLDHGTDLYKVYLLWDRNTVPISSKDLPSLENDEELEVIFLDTQKGKRFVFDEWENNRKEEDYKKYLQIKKRKQQQHDE